MAIEKHGQITGDLRRACLFIKIPEYIATIMDKSLGTNLHLWRFFTRAKQTVTRELNYTCSAPPPAPPTMLDISPEF